ncbi:MAG: hypothetical protein Pg6A_13170 [Termitinemataceae bacterium]|nr:MAG: hypothetical protein Pg6A_13170 [Termitinemataceae bacterium]
MKRFSRSIATVLVLVMLACSFTSCLSYVYRSKPVAPDRILYAVVDIVFLPVSLVALLVYVLVTDASAETGAEAFLASAGNTVSPEYFSLMRKVYALPDAELASLKQMADSIPEAARSSLMERIRSLSEAELAALISAYTALPEAEIISSLNRISALSETERVSLLQDFNSLSEDELASVIEELKSLREEPLYIASADYRHEKAYTRLSFQY